MSCTETGLLLGSMEASRNVKLILLFCAACVAVYLCVEAVQVRDDDDIKFLKDGIEETHQTFQAAAADMDKCPPEPAGVHAYCSQHPCDVSGCLYSNGLCTDAHALA